MDGFLKVSLKKLIENIGEDRVKAILSEFYCPLNSDIEIFLKSKAVEFEKQGISATQLIFTSYKDNPVLVGYYTLSTKAFNISKAAISRTLSKRINKFATYSPELRAYILPAPLIAQLGKNYAGNHNKLLT
ncbi:MAG: N-acetyltransferase, partial [Eubacterium sp.]|nr:N-acetyltransferase [Eubacterium sp.]